jgi:hypothetical protein
MQKTPLAEVAPSLPSSSTNVEQRRYQYAQAVRISEELRGRIESWALSRPAKPSLSETIRPLIELTLNHQNGG